MADIIPIAWFDGDLSTSEQIIVYEDDIINQVMLTCNNLIEVYVDTRDVSDNPYFHVVGYKLGANKDWSSSIRFNSAEYYIHELNFEKIHDPRIVEYLDTLLRMEKVLGDPDKTYWKTAIRTWNSNNGGAKVSESLEQPDYRVLDN